MNTIKILLISLICTSFFFSCAKPGFEFVDSNGLKININGATQKSIDTGSYSKVEGLDAYLVYTTDIVSQNTVNLYIKGQEKEISIKGEGLDMVTSFAPSYIKAIDLLVVEGHINPSLASLITYQVKNNKISTWFYTVFAIDAAGNVLALLDPPHGTPADATTTTAVIINETDIGTIPFESHEILISADGFTIKGSAKTWTVKKTADKWELK